jgi:hypothetical protein
VFRAAFGGGCASLDLRAALTKERGRDGGMVSAVEQRNGSQSAERSFQQSFGPMSTNLPEAKSRRRDEDQVRP